MKIEKELEGTKLNVKVSGRLDTTTAPELEAELKEQFGSIGELVLDFKDLEYISSAGLRVVLNAHKEMNGKMVIENVGEIVMEIFEVTGFADILTIA